MSSALVTCRCVSLFFILFLFTNLGQHATDVLSIQKYSRYDSCAPSGRHTKSATATVIWRRAVCHIRRQPASPNVYGEGQWARHGARLVSVVSQDVPPARTAPSARVERSELGRGSPSPRWMRAFRGASRAASMPGRAGERTGWSSPVGYARVLPLSRRCTAWLSS